MRFIHEVNLYIDESGNLGPGMGRYFLVCALEVTRDDHKALTRRAGRVICRFKNEYGYAKSNELKGTALNNEERNILLSKILYTGIKVRYIVLDLKHTTMILKKADDKNACYNYLIHLLVKNVLDHHKNVTQINLYLDNRTVKIGNRLALKQYLYNKLVMEHLEKKHRLRSVEFKIHYLESKSCYLIEWADIVANSLYKKYNGNDNTFYKQIKPHLVFESRFPSRKFGK